MNAYHAITEKLYDLLIADPDVNTVTKGDPALIDLDKKNIFPLCHVEVYDSGFTTSTIDFGVNVYAMDLRDKREAPVTDKYLGGDNEDYSLNSMLYVLYRLYLQLEKFGDDFYVDNIQRPEAFTEVRHNIVDGWVLNFTIGIPADNVTAC